HSYIPRLAEAIYETRRHVVAAATDLEAGRSRGEGEIRSYPFVDSRVAASAGPVHKEPRNPVHLCHRTLLRLIVAGKRFTYLAVGCGEAMSPEGIYVPVPLGST